MIVLVVFGVFVKLTVMVVEMVKSIADGDELVSTSAIAAAVSPVPVPKSSNVSSLLKLRSAFAREKKLCMGINQLEWARLFNGWYTARKSPAAAALSTMCSELDFV